MPNLYLTDRATAEAACERAAAARLVQLPVFRGAADRRHNFALLTDRAAPWQRKSASAIFLPSPGSAMIHGRRAPIGAVHPTPVAEIMQ